MSNSIFLEPNIDSNNKVYLQIHDTSGQEQSHLKDAFTNKLSEHGLQITENLEAAHYMLQINVLQLGKNLPQYAQKSLKSGYGTAIEGAWIGKSIAKSKKSTESLGSVVGASIATAASAMLDDAMYSAIADVQVSERIDGEATETIKSSLAQGKSTKQEIRFKRKTTWLKYQTRVVTSAARINLKYHTAAPILYEQLVTSISGILN
ncbi:MAG: hypothetical protein HOI53_04825 [Francisellaceae bacterium]|nr:hypothetical protein [Francisellaceae bacterium]MBT6538675.1 hypothetical protein [Francisellaceae bacterium]